MKPPRNRTKLLRIPCGMCNATQDSLRHTCAQCGNPMYTNMSPEELAHVQNLVSDLEQHLTAIESPPQPKPKDKEKASPNPYLHHDKARQGMRELRAFAYLPGMTDYLDAARAVMLPYRIRLMENTLRANVLFCVLLGAFPLLPLLLGWPVTIVAVLAMPALVWLGVTIRAYASLRKARAEIQP